MAHDQTVTTASLVLGLAAAFLAGCTPRGAEISLPLQQPPAFSSTGSASLPERWWTAFDDPALNRLVDRALESNFTLETAWQRLRQAQAVVDRESSLLFPDLNAEFGAEERRPERAEFGDDLDGGRLRLGIASAYEVDLWGNIRSSVEAERHRARATLADYQTAVLSLSAEVARTWYQLAEARSQVELLQGQEDANRQVLDLVDARFRSGQVRSVDVLRQRQVTEATREQRLAAESRAQVLEHLLAVLLGRPPQEGVDPLPAGLPVLPPLPETGLPLDLVQRRPDVQAAYNLLHAADRDLAAAITNRYPRVTLSAALSTAGDTADDLFEDWTRSFTGNLLAPLFDAGQRAAEVDRTEAFKQQRLYEYGEATLAAFREVEDALIQEQKQVERIASLQEQVDIAGRVYEQLTNEYFGGVSDYIEVLTALTEEQQLRRDLIAARMAVVEFRIALYRALAGGFETERMTGGSTGI